MKALVVYDSVFGNTEKVAQAIGDSLGAKEDVAVSRVTDVKLEQIDGLTLLLVGSPTRGFKPTKAIVEFLDRIPAGGLKGVRISAFDTRISAEDVNSRFLKTLMRVFRYAAEPIARKLEKKGGTLTVPPEGFIVKDSEGPLKEGELKRAAGWAKSIMSTMR
ncbi:MAG TPA: flavodoxin family protein [Firmicutes bacterium]|nr:flavodoxin family protein [Bacillota bacterium]